MKRWGKMVGRTPGSARDALVPLSEQRYPLVVGREQADEGAAAGGPPETLQARASGQPSGP